MRILRGTVFLPFLAILLWLTAPLAAAGPTKIIFIPGTPSHGYGMHEHRAGLLLLARSLKQQWPQLETVIADKGWPEADTFADADALVIDCDGSAHAALDHLDQVSALANRGVGIALIHFALEPPPGRAADAVREWIGGVYERGLSVNPDWAPEFTNFPDHPAANGLRPFSVYDEWYFNMRFAPGLKGVTPILQARPPLTVLLRADGPSSGNPGVRESVLRGDLHTLAWAYERPAGGRGFGFSGAHSHHNYRDDVFRKALLNGVAWVAGLEVPPGGVESTRPRWEEIAANQDFDKPANWEQLSGLSVHGNAEPVYDTGPISLDAAQPFQLEVAIPPQRYRHIYFVFEAHSSLRGNARIQWRNPRFRGEPGNEASLSEEKPAHFVGSGGALVPPDDWGEQDAMMEIPAPSLLHYHVPRGATHFLAQTKFHAVGSADSPEKPSGRVLVFFAPPAERYIQVPVSVVSTP